MLSPQERDILDQQLEQWIKQGFVEPSRAWITCNPLFVPKSNGRMRTCIDYRPINAVIPSWDWPLPKIRDMRYHLLGTKWYARIDLKDAFHRIHVAPTHRALTAFHTHRGTYQFTRMPFGLSTAPATYQRFIEWVLFDILGKIIVYLDDILIMGQTRAQVIKRSEQVLQRLARSKVEVNREKSDLTPRQETVFVGMTIKQGRIGCALPVGTEPVPRTIQDWQSALGFANCFRDYLPSYAEKTAGLYPGTNQLPEEERLAKFKSLWSELSSAISLESYDDQKPGNLYLDASKRAVGAVLSQEGKVCAIFSKQLTKSQQNYSATDREHLALMLGLEAFRVMVQSNQKLVTRTDHSALLNRNEERMTARQLRWKVRVMEITSNLVHVAGKDNPADFWSRQGWEWGGDLFCG